MTFLGNYKDEHIDDLVKSVQRGETQAELIRVFSKAIALDLNFNQFIICVKKEGSWRLVNSQNINQDDKSKTQAFLNGTLPYFNKILSNSKTIENEYGYLNQLIPNIEKFIFEFYFIFNTRHIPVLLFSKLEGFSPEYRSRHLALIRASIILAHGMQNVYNEYIKYSESRDNKKGVKSGVLKLKSLMALQTAFLQYWSFFDDYISVAKGVNIEYDVKRHPDGLEIAVKLTEEIEEDMIEAYLHEYFEYLLAKDINTKDKFRTQSPDSRKLMAEIEMLNLEIRTQKSNFLRQIDILETKNNLISLERNNLNSIIKEISKTPIFISQNQFQLQSQSTKIEVLNTFKSFVNQISKYNNKLNLDLEEAEIITEEISKESNQKISPKLSKRIIKFYKSSLEKIKEAKTVLIDTPKVVGGIIAILAILKTSLANFDENYRNLIDAIDRIIILYGS